MRPAAYAASHEAHCGDPEGRRRLRAFRVSENAHCNQAALRAACRLRMSRRTESSSETTISPMIPSAQG